MLELSFLPSKAAHSHAAAAQALRLWGASQEQGMLREGATLLKQLDSARIEVWKITDFRCTCMLCYAEFLRQDSSTHPSMP